MAHLRRQVVSCDPYSVIAALSSFEGSWRAAPGARVVIRQRSRTSLWSLPTNDQGLGASWSHSHVSSRWPWDCAVFATRRTGSTSVSQNTLTMRKECSMQLNRSIRICEKMGEEYDRYSMLIQWDEDDQIYVVTVPELLGCRTHGKTYEE